MNKPKSKFRKIPKIIKRLLARADHTYKQIAFGRDAATFCLFFNISAALRRQNVRFYFDNENRIYTAKSEKYLRYFYAKEQNWNCYESGVAERGQSLGKAYFLNEIDFKNGDLIVDCGANVGDLRLYFQENDLEIKYLGIEPSPREFACLQKNSPESTCLNIGLWSENSELKFFVSSANADSSFIEPCRYTDVITIPTKRLDTVLDEPIKLLKIEAEGAEPEALLGCEGLLNKIDYISADLGFERGVLQESTLAPVTNYLLSNGFELVKVGYPRIVALYKRSAAL